MYSKGDQVNFVFRRHDSASALIITYIIQLKNDRFSSKQRTSFFTRKKCSEGRACRKCSLATAAAVNLHSSSCESRRYNSARRMQGRVRINKAACVSTHLIYLIFRQTHAFHLLTPTRRVNRHAPVSTTG